jgi:aminoglycoside/choline kinase family phosphotransferase
LQQIVNATDHPGDKLRWYMSVIDILVDLCLVGADGFNPDWTFQTPTYDKQLILDRECRYFVDAFLNGFLGMKIDYDTLSKEFEQLADRALQGAMVGFMHRDCQSRNIMVANGAVHFIDFQGGRLGPLQYDLASLLIDPYVSLPDDLRQQLLSYCTDRVADRVPIDRKAFIRSYYHCTLTRNLQALGAYGYLSKRKPAFTQYIPGAVDSLKRILDRPRGNRFQELKAVVKQVHVG